MAAPPAPVASPFPHSATGRGGASQAASSGARSVAERGKVIAWRSLALTRALRAARGLAPRTYPLRAERVTQSLLVREGLNLAQAGEPS